MGYSHQDEVDDDRRDEYRPLERMPHGLVRYLKAMRSRAPLCERTGALTSASDGPQGGLATGQFDEGQDGLRKRNHGCYTAYVNESAKNTTVDTSLFEQIAAALVIVGNAELAEIEEAVEEARGEREAGRKPGPSPYDQRHQGSMDEGA